MSDDAKTLAAKPAKYGLYPRLHLIVPVAFCNTCDHWTERTIIPGGQETGWCALHETQTWETGGCGDHSPSEEEHPNAS